MMNRNEKFKNLKEKINKYKAYKNDKRAEEK